MMEVRLISAPSLEAQTLCGMAAAECYQGKDAARSLRVAMNGGHHSVLEHAAYTFRISGVSRVLLAQLTRHRIASYSVQSQRYCGVKPEWVIPPSIKAAGYEDEYVAVCNAAYLLMQEMMAAGVPAEDARYVIPQGATCSLIMTMNARSLLNFFLHLLKVFRNLLYHAVKKLITFRCHSFCADDVLKTPYSFKETPATACALC